MHDSLSFRALLCLASAALCACERQTPPVHKKDAGSSLDMARTSDAAKPSSSPPRVETILVLEPPESLLHTGQKHAFATFSGKLASWGDNDYGQLGRGGPRPEFVPGPVSSLDNHGKLVAALGAGTSHSCALMMSGSISCWGSNEYRQLGDGSFDDSASPVEVVGIEGHAVALSVKVHHNCALIRDGSVRCWGSAMYEDAGTMMGPALQSATATAVPGLSSGVTQIAVGKSHACALRDEDVMCWGNNSFGQLATKDLTDSSQPVRVQGLQGKITQLVAGDDFTCGLTRSGHILCWGDDEHHQLGHGTSSSTSPWQPVSLWPEASRPVQLTAGATHACARLESGEVACWGSHESGELGAKVGEDALPVKVDGLGAKALDVRAGQGYTCARTGGAQVSCWGWNMYGQLGRGEDAKDLDVPAPLTPPHTLATEKN